MSIRKQLEAYWKAENELRTKMYEYLDKQNKKIDLYLRLDNTDEEIHFIEIKDGYLLEEHGDEWDYKGLLTTELLDVYEQLTMEELNV